MSNPILSNVDVRIVSGSLGGRRLRIKASGDAFRPTAERVREAVASSIMSRIPGAIVADLCAGSGAFGFEMLSRGAAHVDFVESNRPRAQAIESLAREFGVENQCGIFSTDVISFIRNPSATVYDIIFYDPPYSDDRLASLVPDIAKMIGEKGVCIVEHAQIRDMGPMAATAGMSIKTKIYGETAVSYLIRKV
jgi:16S rRNA (guanine966-N2)-methyltransferase